MEQILRQSLVDMLGLCAHSAANRSAKAHVEVSMAMPGVKGSCNTFDKFSFREHCESCSCQRGAALRDVLVEMAVECICCRH